jgi:aspartyl-tRNA(Asn)/glutamyl-tRNA(Gln) amidotransferase subunit C
VSSLTLADVERIAALAHLDLTSDEKARFTRQLADILDYAQQLQEVNTEGVAATAHVYASAGAERDDTLRPSLTPQQAVANAPDANVEAGLFRVPRVIGG